MTWQPNFSHLVAWLPNEKVNFEPCFPTTDSTYASQTASQCLAAGHSLDSFPFDDSEWYSYTRAKDLEVHNKVADFLKIETLGIKDPRDASQEDDFL